MSEKFHNKINLRKKVMNDTPDTPLSLSLCVYVMRVCAHVCASSCACLCACVVAFLESKEGWSIIVHLIPVRQGLSLNLELG